MTAQIRVELNSEGIKALLEGPEVDGMLRREAQKVARRAGAGFGYYTYKGSYGGGRAMGTVRPRTEAAARREAEEKALTKALGGGA